MSFQAGEKSCTIDYAYLRKDGTTQKIPIKTRTHSQCAQEKFSTAKVRFLESIPGFHPSKCVIPSWTPRRWLH